MPRTRAPGLAVALVGLLVAAGCSASRPASARLVFSDRFDGTDLSARRWGTCHWWAPDGCTIETNDELEGYVASQVAVRDGALALTAVEDPVVVQDLRLPYRSGMVSTGRPGDEPTDEPRFAFTYGRVEVRFRIPRATGSWPAIWMLPASNEALPEIDLLEVHGQTPDRPAVTLHTTDGGRERRDVRTADLSTGWHTVRLDWGPGRLVWSIDGVEALRVTGDDVPSEPMYLVANLAVGADAGEPDPATFPATFLIDHVRVWARP